MPAKALSRLGILKAFFYRNGTDSLLKFSEELKALSEGEKIELSSLAAKEMGLEVKG